VHFSPSTKGDNSIKDRIIAKLANANCEPLFSIIASNLTEQDAHDIEMEAIKKTGRINLKTGPLANLTNGGEGMSGYLGLWGSNNPSSRPIIAEGRQFSCCSEADRNLGLTKGRTRYRIEHGWPGYYRVGEDQKPCRKGRRTGISHKGARAVIANGKRYPLLSDAASDLGVCLSAIHKRIHAGWPGYYYEGEDQLPRLRAARHSSEHIASMRSNTTNKSKAVSIDGIVFPSLSKAGRSLGVSYVTIRNKCNDKKFPSYCFI
jgi:hypothetical protein